MNKNYHFLVIVTITFLTTTLLIPKIVLADNSVSISMMSEATEYVAKAKQAEKLHDYNDAITWYQKAAELGDAKSMNELGWIYFGSHDIPGRHLQDYSKGTFWFQKAADLNYIPAITQLGVMYGSDGSFGVPEDHVKSARLFLKAAEAGDAQAMDNLGVMYSQGKGVPRDIDEAVRWWKKAVEVDKDGQAGKAAQTWLDLHDGKPFCLYCLPPK